MDMKKASVTVAVLVLMSTLYLALTVLPGNARAVTFYVGGSGPGNYTLITDAITDASDGDVIYVYSGTYNEDVSVYKRLTLMGEDRDTTVIRGTGAADTVLVTVDWVNITGFTVTHSKPSEAGIRLFFVQNCYLANNNISDNGNGITFWQSGFNTVTDSLMSRNGVGVFFSGQTSSNNNISNNIISNGGSGVYMESHNDNTITDNVIANNSYGIYMSSSMRNVITGNVMFRNGILVLGSSLQHWNTHTIDTTNTIDGEPIRYWKGVTGSTIPQNTGQAILVNCTDIAVNDQNNSHVTVGIEVAFSSHVTINDNLLTHNSYDGIYVYRSDNITMDRNNASNSGNEGISVHITDAFSITNNTVLLNGMNGLHLFAGERFTISNNTFVSNSLSHPEPVFRMEYCAVYISYSNRSVIADNAILSNLNCAFSLINSNVNTVSNNNISNNGNGAYFGGGEYGRVINNTISSNAVIGMSVGSFSHSTIAFNAVMNHEAGIYMGYSHDNIVVGNSISSKSDSTNQNGITIDFSTSQVVRDNVMVGDGLLVRGKSLDTWNTHVIDTSNLVNGRPVRYWKNVTGGTVPLDASEVILANCTGVTVSGQDIREGAAGIEIAYSSNNTFVDNNVTGTKLSIYLYTSHGNDIDGNTVSDSLRLPDVNLLGSNSNMISNNGLRNSWAGIGLATSHNNAITGNAVWNNVYYGIWLARSDIHGLGSQNNSIDNNTIFNNGLDGVRVIYSDNNTIAYNSIVGNPEGVHVSQSDNNLIHHNNIANNFLQAYDDRSTNNWDDGYPSGGNWWSDYIGVDAMSGPNQDVPGVDGIGDTPYIIDGDSRDRYPLMVPSTTSPPSAPLNLSASPGDQQIILTWNPPSFDGGLPVTNYRIYRGTTAGGETFHAQIGNLLTYIDTGLTNGQMYCYKVSAVNAAGEGPTSSEACAMPTTTPGAPTVTEAILSGTGMENVTIRWSLSSDDGAGQRSVISYVVMRGMTYDPNGLGYASTATLPKGTTEYVDSLSGEGDANNYFYLVCAVDLNDLANCSSNQAGKFTRSLLNGPNLVSIPLIQSVSSIDTILQTVKWDKAWTHDSSVQKWKSYMTFKPYKGELWELNVTMGFWVNVTEQSNLTVAGIVPSTTSIHLHAGWNLVGFPSFNATYAVSDLKASVGVERIEGFDALTPPYFLIGMTDGEVFQAGYGYWVKAANETIWIVASS